MSKDVTDDDDDVVVVVVENLVIKDNDDDDDGLVLNCLARVDARDLRLLWLLWMTKADTDEIVVVGLAIDDRTVAENETTAMIINVADVVGLAVALRW